MRGMRGKLPNLLKAGGEVLIHSLAVVKCK